MLRFRAKSLLISSRNNPASFNAIDFVDSVNYHYYHPPSMTEIHVRNQIASIRELIRGAVYIRVSLMSKGEEILEIRSCLDIALRKVSKRRVSDCVKEFELK